MGFMRRSNMMAISPSTSPRSRSSNSLHTARPTLNRMSCGRIMKGATARRGGPTQLCTELEQIEILRLPFSECRGTRRPLAQPAGPPDSVVSRSSSSEVRGSADLKDAASLDQGGYAASTDSVEIDNSANGIGPRWDVFQDRLRERRKDVIRLGR